VAGFEDEDDDEDENEAPHEWHQTSARMHHQLAKTCRTRSDATFRAYFATDDPGLKPWAMIYSRFAAKSDNDGEVRRRP